MIAALACLSVVAMLLFLHPYIGYPLSLRLFRQRPLDENGPPPMKMSLLFSAYNEERSLPEKIANLRAIKELYPDLEILAYDDASSDRTADLLRAESDLLSAIIAPERAGKATGMRRMVAQASGDICIFTDANVTLDPSSIAALQRHFQDPEIGGVAGALYYTNEDASTTAKVGGMYWRLEEWIKRLESRCGSIMGADGSIFATRRHLYPVVPPHLLDDMTASMAVPLAGKRLIHATDVRAFERSATSSADEFRRKRRIACRAYNTHRHLWPSIRGSFGLAGIYKYVSHKLLRWFGLAWLAVSLALAAAVTIALGQWWLALAGAAAALAALALGRAGAPVLGQCYQVLLSIAATFLGVVDAQRGLTYQTWSPAKSRDVVASVEVPALELEATC